MSFVAGFVSPAGGGASAVGVVEGDCRFVGGTERRERPLLAGDRVVGRAFLKEESMLAKCKKCRGEGGHRDGRKCSTCGGSGRVSVEVVDGRNVVAPAPAPAKPKK